MAETALPEMDWPAAAATPGATLDRPRFTARILPPAGATLIGGDLAAALADLAPGAPLVGLGGETGEGAHALRIARDRALLITADPLAAAEGWRPGSDRAGWAASAADDAWIALEIAGAGAADVIAQGTAADLALGSPSAMTLFAGRPMLLARRGDAFRLHGEAPFREYLWEWLAGAA